MPSLRQLQAFKAVMETRSISRAADRMFLTQPAVSKLINGLETESGLRLFTRHKQRIAPTAEAHLYLIEAESLFQNLGRLERLAQDLKTMVHTNLTVACYPAIAINLMPRVLNGFHQRHENTTSTLLIRSSPRLGDLAIAQQFDVGVSMLPVLHRDVISVPCLQERMMVVMRPDHRLAGRREIAPSDLDGEPFVSMGHDDRSSFVVDDYFQKAEVSPKIMTRVALSAAICEFIRDGAGVSLLGPVTMSGPIADGLVSVPLRPALNFQAHLLIPRQRPASAIREQFLAHLPTALTLNHPELTTLSWQV